jgi:hypothetical protein
VTGTALALRCWELDRVHLALISFNARPGKPPAWWMANAFDTPVGSWPYDRPLKAECKGGREHQAHDPDDCEVEGCDHQGGIPAPVCRCGIYGTRDLTVVSDYLRAATAPVLGLIEMGGRTIMADPDRPAYARAQYARAAAILLVDRSLTVDHGTLRRLADAYDVPALVPHSVDPEDYSDVVVTTSTLADEAEEYVRRQAES